MPRKNPKKHEQDRRVRPKGSYAMPVKFKKVITKSRAGVKYTKFAPIIPRNPGGLNHLAKRRFIISRRRMAEGKKAYFWGGKKGDKRIYIKNEKSKQNI